MIRKLRERPKILREKDSRGRTYYNIMYFDYKKQKYIIGYGSYTKKYVKNWKKNLLKVWRKNLRSVEK